MNTCKAAMRILKARKLYVIIYLVLIGTMMLSISWQIMRGSSTAGSSTYEPKAARIAVIDRDNNAEHVAESLRSYLALDGEMVGIDDDSVSLQQAVASNYVDLIAIVPNGFAEHYLQYADGGTDVQPTIDTVVSYSWPAAIATRTRHSHDNGIGYCQRRYETIAYRRGVFAFRR